MSMSNRRTSGIVPTDAIVAWLLEPAPGGRTCSWGIRAQLVISLSPSTRRNRGDDGRVPPVCHRVVNVGSQDLKIDSSHDPASFAKLLHPGGGALWDPSNRWAYRRFEVSTSAGPGSVAPRYHWLLPPTTSCRRMTQVVRRQALQPIRCGDRLAVASGGSAPRR